MPVDLSNYITVNERIAKFYELFAQGRLVTGEVRVSNEPDGVPRVLVQALAYRTPDDPLPGVGWSWMPLPGKSNFTRDSELENTETSAWGRAIASLGILIDGGLASGDEIKNKTDDGSGPPAGRPAPPRLPPRTDPATADPPADVPYSEAEELMGRVRRKGTIKKGTAEGYKVDARIGPEGHVIGFRLEVGAEKHIPQCLVAGPLGEALYQATGEHPDVLIGVGATVAGILYHVKSPKGSWYRLHVDSIETTINGLDVILPAAHNADAIAEIMATLPDDPDLPAPPEDVPLTGEKVA